MPGKEIALDALTVDDLINLGPNSVSDRLPKSLLLTVTRLYVSDRIRQRERHAALSAERRAYRIATGEDHDDLDMIVNNAAMQAASLLVFDWKPLLEVSFLVPTHDRFITWGAAATSDHVDRAQWLERHAAGSLRSAVQHRAAVDAIARVGGENLIDVVNAK